MISWLSSKENTGLSAAMQEVLRDIVFPDGEYMISKTWTVYLVKNSRSPLIRGKSHIIIVENRWTESFYVKFFKSLKEAETFAHSLGNYIYDKTWEDKAKETLDRQVEERLSNGFLMFRFGVLDMKLEF